MISTIRDLFREKIYPLYYFSFIKFKTKNQQPSGKKITKRNAWEKIVR